MIMKQMKAQQYNLKMESEKNNNQNIQNNQGIRYYEILIPEESKEILINMYEKYINEYFCGHELYKIEFKNNINNINNGGNYNTSLLSKICEIIFQNIPKEKDKQSLTQALYYCTKRYCNSKLIMDPKNSILNNYRLDLINFANKYFQYSNMQKYQKNMEQNLLNNNNNNNNRSQNIQNNPKSQYINNNVNQYINNNVDQYLNDEEFKRIWGNNNINNNNNKKYEIIISDESKKMLINMYKMINMYKENIDINKEIIELNKEIDNVNLPNSYNTPVLFQICDIISNNILEEGIIHRKNITKDTIISKDTQSLTQTLHNHTCKYNKGGLLIEFVSFANRYFQYSNIQEYYKQIKQNYENIKNSRQQPQNVRDQFQLDQFSNNKNIQNNLRYYKITISDESKKMLIEMYKKYIEMKYIDKINTDKIDELDVIELDAIELDKKIYVNQFIKEINDINNQGKYNTSLLSQICEMIFENIPEEKNKQSLTQALYVYAKRYESTNSNNYLLNNYRLDLINFANKYFQYPNIKKYYKNTENLRQQTQNTNILNSRNQFQKQPQLTQSQSDQLSFINNNNNNNKQYEIIISDESKKMLINIYNMINNKENININNEIIELTEEIDNINLPNDYNTPVLFKICNIISKNILEEGIIHREDITKDTIISKDTQSLTQTLHDHTCKYNKDGPLIEFVNFANEYFQYSNIKKYHKIIKNSRQQIQNTNILNLRNQFQEQSQFTQSQSGQFQKQSQFSQSQFNQFQGQPQFNQFQFSQPQSYQFQNNNEGNQFQGFKNGFSFSFINNNNNNNNNNELENQFQDNRENTQIMETGNQNQLNENQFKNENESKVMEVAENQLNENQLKKENESQISQSQFEKEVIEVEKEESKNQF